MKQVVEFIETVVPVFLLMVAGYFFTVVLFCL